MESPTPSCFSHFHDRKVSSSERVETCGRRCGSIGYSVKSAKWAIKQRAKRVGDLVTAMKARGLTSEQIVAELTR